MSKPIFQILAEGLQASVNGKGWNKKHERARKLANAAPKMLAVLKRFQAAPDQGDLDRYDWAALDEAIKEAE